MSTLVLLLILSLAAARLTRLAVEDEITLPARKWIAVRLGAESRITYLVHCRWCSGLWVSALLCGFAWITGICPDGATAALLIPAVAYAAAIARSTIEE